MFYECKNLEGNHSHFYYRRYKNKIFYYLQLVFDIKIIYLFNVNYHKYYFRKKFFLKRCFVNRNLLFLGYLFSSSPLIFKSLYIFFCLAIRGLDAQTVAFKRSHSHRFIERLDLPSSNTKIFITFSFRVFYDM